MKAMYRAMTRDEFMGIWDLHEPHVVKALGWLQQRAEANGGGPVRFRQSEFEGAVGCVHGSPLLSLVNARCLGGPCYEWEPGPIVDLSQCDLLTPRTMWHEQDDLYPQDGPPQWSS